jgi:hypothetical protein
MRRRVVDALAGLLLPATLMILMAGPALAQRRV